MTDNIIRASIKDNTSFIGGINNETDEVKSIKPKPKSIIGHNIQFRGELIGKEDMLIEGQIQGTVLMEGHNLTIGQNGHLEANVHAQTLCINGKLTGDVLADELIEIKDTAVVKGNLIAPRIQLEDGGKFRGSMDMIDTDTEQSEQHKVFKEKLVHPNLPTQKPERASTNNNKEVGTSRPKGNTDSADTN